MNADFSPSKNHGSETGLLSTVAIPMPDCGLLLPACSTPETIERPILGISQDTDGAAKSAALHPEVESDSTPGVRNRPSMSAADADTLRTADSRVQHCTADELAAAAGVSRRMIFLALKVQRAGCPEVLQMVRADAMTMNLAAVLVGLFPSHDDQRTVIAEFATLPPRQWLGFAQRVSALTKGGLPC